MSADAPDTRPLVFAYDGSELAGQAIDEAGRVLDTTRDAFVVTVWQPFDLGFLPLGGTQLDAADIAAVRGAAEETAGEGASRAQAAGFRARGVAVEAAPTWKALSQFAESHDAAVIVLGSHGRTGLGGVVLGSVAGATATRCRRSVLVIHRDE